MNSASIRKIRSSFDGQSMMATLGASLAHISKGEVTVVAPILDGSRQQHGFAHAGLTFALGDSAAGYAALSIMAPEDEVLTAEMKINLIAPAKGDIMRATGRVIKPGRRLVVVSAEVHMITNNIETLIAVLQGTMVPVTSVS
ncbi:MAG: PaaI family thioesterase [Paracoccaceae bacterium]